MFEVDQVLVKSLSLEEVTTQLGAVITASGFRLVQHELPVDDSLSLPGFKKYRHFYVSFPVDEWVCVIENLPGDENLAQVVSERLKTKCFWFSYSDIAEEFSFAIYEQGTILDRKSFNPKQADGRKIKLSKGFRKRTASESMLIKVAEEFYRKNGLPFPLYSYEQVDGTPNKDQYFIHLNFENLSNKERFV